MKIKFGTTLAAAALVSTLGMAGVAGALPSAKITVLGDIADISGYGSKILIEQDAINCDLFRSDIKKAIEGGLISNRGGMLYLKSDGTPLCGDNEEPTLNIAARFLNLPKHQELKFSLEAKLKQ